MSKRFQKAAKAFKQTVKSLANFASRKRTRVLQGVLALALATAAFMHYRVYSMLTVQDNITYSLVVIRGERGLGSGVVVASDEGGSWILTNKHVCNLGDPNAFQAIMLELSGWGEVVTKVPVLVKDVKGQNKSWGQVYKIAQNSDLCLVFTLQPNLPVAPISDTYPEEGDVILNYGNPLGIEGHLGSSRFQGYTLSVGMYAQISNLPIRPGSSGSGVFNTDGELIGLINAGSGFGEQTTAIAVPLQAIKAFIHELGK